MHQPADTNKPHYLFLSIAAASGFLSVALGAFTAHGLKKVLSADLLQTFQTGVEYQFLHCIALLFIATLPRQDRWSTISGWSFVAGMVLFSGSLYILSLSGTGLFGAITPLGGLCFLAGWASLFVHAWKRLPG